jgi:hypothetical protein
VVSPAPRQDWEAETGGVRSVRFSDPDGHALALVQFPPGKGAPRWQRPTDRVFLGIDRSATVVPSDAPSRRPTAPTISASYERREVVQALPHGIG